MSDRPSQIHSTEGMDAAAINKALKEGRLADLLDGVEGEGRYDGAPEQRDATWVRQASPAEINAALREGRLNDLL